MKNQLMAKLNYLWNFLKLWRELSSIAVALLLWMNSGWLLRQMDPTAATYDAGVFQVYLFATVGLFLLHGVVRILMKLIWPTSDHYLDQHFANDFNQLAPWQKLKLSTAIFFGFLLAAVLLARII